MSSENSPSSPSSPGDAWAGKSRNAKAQARHRAKRKAYIEQLEQTVSKLQAALALTADDITNLPTAQMKLRELKEENDALRAEVQKLRLLQCYNYAMQSQSQSQAAAAASLNEYPRHLKRRRTAYGPEPRGVYLEPEHPTYQFTPNYLSATRVMPIVPSSTAADFASVPTQAPPVMESPCAIKEEFAPWPPFQPRPNATAPPGWRPRTASSSSETSDTSPLLLAQTQGHEYHSHIAPNNKFLNSNEILLSHDHRYNGNPIDKLGSNVLLGAPPPAFDESCSFLKSKSITATAPSDTWAQLSSSSWSYSPARGEYPIDYHV